MKSFAHGGIEHSSEIEAAAHSSATIVAVAVLITAGAIVTMGLLVFLLKRYSSVGITVKNKEK